MNIRNINIIILLLAGTLWGARVDQNFADQLYNEKDYYNAIYAYKAAIFSTNEIKQKEELQLKLAQTYINNNNFSLAEPILNNLIETANYQKKPAQRILAEQYYVKQNYDKAFFEFQDYAKLYSDQKYLYLSGWAQLKQNNYEQAALAFGLVATPNNYEPAAQKLAKTVIKGKQLPQKNITLAQFLSGIIPGSGQLYAENWQDGLVSFIVNGLTISLMSNAFSNSRTGEGLLWLTLESAWYFGGIYSAGNSADKYNDSVKNRFIEDLEEEYHPQELLESK